MKSISLFLILFRFCFTLCSQEIVFSTSELSLKQALDELNNVGQLNISYNSSSEHMAIELQLGRREWLVPEALSFIESQAPIDFIFEDGHIIAAIRNLPEHFVMDGRVSFNGAGIDGANLVITETLGMISDEEGYFRFVLKPGSYRLTVSFMGYRTFSQHISLFQNQTLDIELEEEPFHIQEASITGHRSDLDDLEIGRSIISLDRKDLGSYALNNASDALQARISGVWASRVSGAPGDHQRIRIRGISSILGSSDPLYIVDGLPVPVVNLKSLGIGDLNAKDIQKISVLKDASSTAFYGYMGANGVVLIETGGGESFGSGISFSYSAGLQQFNNYYPLMDSKAFLNSLAGYDEKFGTKFYYTDSSKYIYPKYPEYLDSIGNPVGNTQWQKEVFRYGSIQEYQLSFQKKLKQLNFYLSGNLFKHQGVVQRSSYERYSALAKFSRDFGPKLQVGLVYRGSMQLNQNNLDNYLGNNVILKGINYEPSYYSTPDSTLNEAERLYFNDPYPSVSLLADQSYRPEQLFNEVAKNKEENIHNIQFSGTYRLPFNMQIQARFGASFRDMEYSTSLPQLKYMQSSEGVRILSQEFILNYFNTWGAHHLSSSIRIRNYNDNAIWEVDSTLNVDIVGLAPEDNIYIRGSQAIYGQSGSVTRSSIALIGQLNYRFRSAYNISLLANYDHLKEGHFLNVKQLFPSISLSWDLARESFMSGILNLDRAEFYGSWGISGSYPLNSLSNDVYYQTDLGSARGQTDRLVFISNLGNYGLKHEKISEYNLGFHLTLFDHRIDARFDRYFRKHSDLLLRRAIPYYYGGGDMLMNVGEMESRGFELSLEAYPVLRPNFHWLLRAGYSESNQILTSLDVSDTLLFYHNDILVPTFAAIVNERPGELYGYRYLGTVDEVFTQGTAPDSEGYTGEGKFILNQVVYAKPDTVNTEKLGKEDYTKIGNSLPDFTLHLANALQFKNWQLEMLWYAVIGSDKYNASRAATHITGTHSNVNALLLDSVSSNLTEELYRSSFFVEDASFIRLKTLSIGYRFPRKILRKFEIFTSLNLENIFTFTPYSGYDPEASIYTDNNFSDNAIDRGAYPSPRGIYFTLKINY